jgi:hypothetical protein
MYDAEERDPDQPTERPWIVLKTTYDVEAWIDQQNRSLQQLFKNSRASGWGICFGMTEGGEIFLHTTAEGNVLLDVTPDAQWLAPLITAATQIDMPATQIWVLPSDRLTQLVFGLSSLIATTRLVPDHDFRLKKY